jgi:transposase InsO family protein
LPLKEKEDSWSLLIPNTCKAGAEASQRSCWPVANNVLNQEFTTGAPNEKWVNEITYIWTKEGWLYLAVVLDWT